MLRNGELCSRLSVPAGKYCQVVPVISRVLLRPDDAPSSTQNLPHSFQSEESVESVTAAVDKLADVVDKLSSIGENFEFLCKGQQECNGLLKELVGHLSNPILRQSDKCDGGIEKPSTSRANADTDSPLENQSALFSAGNFSVTFLNCVISLTSRAFICWQADK